MIIVSEFPVGDRTVRIVSDVWVAMKATGLIRAQWDPDVPRTMGEAEWRQYRAGRHAHFLKIARAIDATVLVVE